MVQDIINKHTHLHYCWCFLTWKGTCSESAKEAKLFHWQAIILTTIKEKLPWSDFYQKLQRRTDHITFNLVFPKRIETTLMLPRLWWLWDLLLLRRPNSEPFMCAQSCAYTHLKAVLKAHRKCAFWRKCSRIRK